MQDYAKALQDMTWSFSRIHSYEQCPYEFYLNYLFKDEDGHRIYEGEDNFYGAFGSFCHELLAAVFNREISAEEAYIKYQEDYDDRLSEFWVKDSTKESYFYKGLRYFSDFNPETRDFDILGVEQKNYFTIGNYSFVAIIDLLLRKKSTGQIILLDHKSSDYPIGKRGGVLKSKQKTFESYKRQLYLYCKPVFDSYGVYPSHIGWNYFKESKDLILPFDEVEYSDSINWAVNTIHQIEKEDQFPENIDHFYCTQLCRFRKGTSTCEYADGGV